MQDEKVKADAQDTGGKRTPYDRLPKIKKDMADMLNRLGEEWCEVKDDEGRIAEKLAIEETIFRISFNLFSKESARYEISKAAVSDALRVVSERENTPKKMKDAAAHMAKTLKAEAKEEAEAAAKGKKKRKKSRSHKKDEVVIDELGDLAEALPAFYTGIRRKPLKDGSYKDDEAYGRSAFSNFDCSKDNLYNYMYFHLSNIATEMKRNEDQGERRENIPVTGNSKDGYVKGDYISHVHDDELIAGSTDGKEDMYDRILLNEENSFQVLAIVNTILSMKDHLSKRQQNAMRMRVYHMLYTDDMTALCKSLSPKLIEMNAIPEYLCRRESFEAMDLPFLDYYMTQVCRDALSIERTPLKHLSELFENGPETEAGLPLDNRVYVAFLKRQGKNHKTVTVGRISQIRSDYYEFLRKQLGAEAESHNRASEPE